MNPSPKLKRAETGEAPKTGENRFAKIPPDLDDLLERGEISSEEFALYLEMADAAEANSQRVRFRPREDRFSSASPRK